MILRRAQRRTFCPAARTRIPAVDRVIRSVSLPAAWCRKFSRVSSATPYTFLQKYPTRQENFCTAPGMEQNWNYCMTNYYLGVVLSRQPERIRGAGCAWRGIPASLPWGIVKRCPFPGTIAAAPARLIQLAPSSL